MALPWSLPSGAAAVTLLVPEGGLAISGPGLVAGEPSELEGRTFASFTTDALPRGGRLALRLDVPASRHDPDALSVVGVRLFLELDDAALSVSEEHFVTVEGSTPLVAPGDRPLLRIPLPEGAREVRFSPATLAAGATVEAGELVVRGPLAAGPGNIELGYRLSADETGVDLVRRFGSRVPTLELYIADTGLEVISDRLHRLRTVSSNDRLYMHFEAFYVEPEETLITRLAPVRRRRGPPRALVAAGVGLAGLATAFFLAAPLLRQSEDGTEDTPEPVTRRERQALYASIHDLDHDYETGKVAEDDYATLRTELRARALALPAEERATAGEASPQPPACPACGVAATADARFCSQCGAAIHTGSTDPGAAA